MVSTQWSQAQQYPLFTNYIVNKLGFNPAVAGTSECVNVMASHRQQWVGVSENPRTSIMTIHSKVKKAPIGIGGYVFADNAGALKRTGASLALSYAMKLDSGSYLGIGISSGYYGLQLGSNSRVSDPSDPTYVAGLSGKGFPDFNAGVYFQRKGLWAGFSTPQIMEKKINFNPAIPNELKRHYMLMAGYEIPVSKSFAIEPSAMGRYVENAPFSWDASLKLIFNQKFYVAGNYRHKDALAAVVGMDPRNGFKFYYAYDMTTSSLNQKSGGTHEFGLGMSLCKKKDSDGDGVPDDVDKCPDKPGPKENKGCPEEEEKKEEGPDSDKDGVLDKDDQCPNVPGPKENKGCPFADRDNDGIRDDIDKCPDVAGLLSNEGCPLKDRDKDGIVDEKDPCPDEYGEIANFGCPPGKLPPGFDPNKFNGYPDEYNTANDDPNRRNADGRRNKRFPNAKPGDRDGDGIPDEKDPCPNTPGENGAGCPDIPIEARNAIDFAIRNVYFDTDKAEIKEESFDYLNRLAEWMLAHEEYNIDMQGHTDKRNSTEYNEVLSKNRVNNAKSYLMSKGIESYRVKISWFGEARPVTTGDNEAAYRKNRRVEMQWNFD